MWLFRGGPPPGPAILRVCGEGKSRSFVSSRGAERGELCRSWRSPGRLSCAETGGGHACREAGSCFRIHAVPDARNTRGSQMNKRKRQTSRGTAGRECPSGRGGIRSLPQSPPRVISIHEREKRCGGRASERTAAERQKNESVNQRRHRSGPRGRTEGIWWRYKDSGAVRRRTLNTARRAVERCAWRLRKGSVAGHCWRD